MLLVVAFLLVAVAETVLCERHRSLHPASRWFGNLALFLLGGGLTWLPFVAGAMSACAASLASWGLLRHAGLPAVVTLALGVLLLDFANYALHRLYHAVEPLWRLHAVHHSDPEVDVSTTLRQHPVAILLSAFTLAVLVALFGVPPDAIAIYLALHTTVSLLSHADLAMPRRLDAVLARVLVTPALHRLHHSRRQVETDSNFGEVFSLWDRMFGTHRGPDAVEPEFGLDTFRERQAQLPHRLLLQPFAGPTSLPATLQRRRKRGAEACGRID